MHQPRRLRQARFAVKRDPTHAWKQTYQPMDPTPLIGRSPATPAEPRVPQPAIDAIEHEEPERWDGLS